MKTVRILIADDHDIVREGLKGVLQGRPDWIICDEAATGREAVDMARKHRPDLVVLDFTMPELNGLEATRQIRKSLPQTEVLIVTMHSSEDLAREALAAGARGFLLKTDARRYLSLAVEALAQHKPFFAPVASGFLLDAFPYSGKRLGATRTDGARLTLREREVTQLIAEGRTTKETAANLGIGAKTAATHRANIMKKLGLHSVSELVRYAVRNHIIEP